MDLQALLALTLATNSALARKDASFARLDFKPSELTNPFFEVGELEFRAPGSAPKSFGEWVVDLVERSADFVRVLSSSSYGYCGLLVTFANSDSEAWLTHAAVDEHGYGTLVEDAELGAWDAAPTKCVFVAKRGLGLATGVYGSRDFVEFGASLLNEVSLDKEWEGRMSRIVAKLLPPLCANDYGEPTRKLLAKVLYMGARGNELSEPQRALMRMVTHARIRPMV